MCDNSLISLLFALLLLQIGDSEHLERQRSDAEARRQQCLQEMNQHRGSLGVVQQNAREAKKALSDPRYHQIADRYRKQLVEVRGLGFRGNARWVGVPDPLPAAVGADLCVTHSLSTDRRLCLRQRLC